MTTFTYSLNDDIGKVRLGIGDRVEDAGPRPDNANFTDEELQFLVDNEGTWQRAIAAALEILSHEWARVADLTVGDRKEAFGMVSKQYASRAESIREVHGGSSTSAAYSVGLTRVDGYSEEVEANEGRRYG